MKKIVCGVLIITGLLMAVGVWSKKSETNHPDTQYIPQEDNRNESNNANEINEVMKSVKAIIEGTEYLINLEDNETAKSFASLLPRELEMDELNGNEKFIYLDTALPTNPAHPQTINAGDVMLYGDNCLVIFYKSFATSYSYTKVGHIDNLPDLGKGKISVLFAE